MYPARMAVAPLLAFALSAPSAAAGSIATSVVQTTLVDQAGHTFALRDLRGTPLVVTFVAAHCVDVCPLVNAQFARASERLRDRHVRLLTITLDPEHDGYTDMRGIARTFDADPHRWIVASGTVANVHRVMSAFGVVAQQGKDGYADVHTTFIYFIDRRGRLYKTDLASTDLADQIVSEIASAWRALTA